MPLVVDYTLATFDSYATLDEAKQLNLAMEGARDITAWLGLSDAERENVLRFATRELADVRFMGQLSGDVVSGLAVWPRTGVYYPNGIAVPDDATPDFVKRWQSARGLELATFGPSVYSSAAGGPVKREKLDGVGETEYFSPPPTGDKAVLASDSVRYIQPWLSPTQTSGNVARWVRY